MKAEAIDKVTREVSRAYPQMAGVRPLVKSQKGVAGAAEQFVLTYKTNVPTAEGRSIHLVVRVISDATGRISRMSTSR